MPCPTLLFMAVGCKIESKHARFLSIGHYLHFFGTIPNPTIVKNRTSDSARILREVGEVPFPDVQATMSNSDTRADAEASFISYLLPLNSFKRERTTSFTDSTANGRIL